MVTRTRLNITFIPTLLVFWISFMSCQNPLPLFSPSLLCHSILQSLQTTLHLCQSSWWRNDLVHLIPWRRLSTDQLVQCRMLMMMMMMTMMMLLVLSWCSIQFPSASYLLRHWLLRSKVLSNLCSFYCARISELLFLPFSEFFWPTSSRQSIHPFHFRAPTSCFSYLSPHS
jgi:hypothetical protein